MKIISNLFIFCFFLFSTRFSFAQYKVTFLVKQPSVLHKADRLFIAGSFNGWDPGDTEFEIDTIKNGITFYYHRVIMNINLQKETGRKLKLHRMEKEFLTVF